LPGRLSVEPCRAQTHGPKRDRFAALAANCIWGPGVQWDHRLLTSKAQLIDTATGGSKFLRHWSGVYTESVKAEVSQADLDAGDSLLKLMQLIERGTVLRSSRGVLVGTLESGSVPERFLPLFRIPLTEQGQFR